MSDAKEKEDKKSVLESISIDEAARTALVQSIAFSAHNEVDAMRNQSTVEMVALGSAYAKWLENPTMADEFEHIVSKTSMSDKSFYDRHPLNKESDEPVRLATQVFRQFLSSETKVP
jgi:hypothetical protein